MIDVLRSQGRGGEGLLVIISQRDRGPFGRAHEQNVAAACTDQVLLIPGGWPAA